MPAARLDLSRIRAISIDLDDTLWPIWPTIARAEQVLRQWLAPRAAATAHLLADREAAHALRQTVVQAHPHLAHDLGALRREAIRAALQQAGDDAGLADAAFAVFFAERQRVTLFDDALPTLQHLCARYPVASLSNGNADPQAMGLGAYFHASVNARDIGVAKPDVRIFEATAQTLGVPAEAVLHVGDDPTMDVQGALRAGMQALWLNREGAAWPHPHEQPHATVSSLHPLREWI